MVRSTRTILAAGVALAVGISGVTVAGAGTTGAANQVSTIKGKVAPKRLDKREFSTVNLTTGVTTLNEDEAMDGTVPAQESEAITIDFDKDIRFDLTEAARCLVDETALAGTTTAQARTACGEPSVISSKGDAAARFAGFATPSNEINDLVVTAFRGNDLTEVILHASSPTLGPGQTQIVRSLVIGSPVAGFGDRLDVPVIPKVAGGAGALVRFFATISKSSGVVTARCKGADLEFDFAASFTYADDSMDTATDTSPCTRKPPRP